MILNKSGYIVSLVYALKEQQNTDPFFLEEEREKAVKFTVTWFYGIYFCYILFDIMIRVDKKSSSFYVYFIHKFSKPLKLSVDENLKKFQNLQCILFDIKSKNKRQWNFYTAVKEVKTSEMNHFQISLFMLEQSYHLKKKYLFLSTIKPLFHWKTSWSRFWTILAMTVSLTTLKWHSGVHWRGNQGLTCFLILL